MSDIMNITESTSSNGMIDLSKELAAKSRSYNTELMVNSNKRTKELASKIFEFKMENSKYEAERAMANAASSRLLSKLSSKFSLISKIQQNMG